MSASDEYSATEAAIFDAAAHELELLCAVALAARDCICDARTSDNSDGVLVNFNQGGHRRIRLADALKALG